MWKCSACPLRTRNEHVCVFHFCNIILTQTHFVSSSCLYFSSRFWHAAVYSPNSSASLRRTMQIQVKVQWATRDRSEQSVKSLKGKKFINVQNARDISTCPTCDKKKEKVGEAWREMNELYFFIICAMCMQFTEGLLSASRKCFFFFYCNTKTHRYGSVNACIGVRV